MADKSTGRRVFLLVLIEIRARLRDIEKTEKSHEIGNLQNFAEDFGIGDGGEVFVGAFGAEEILGGMGVSADNDRDMQRLHLLDEPLAGIVVGMATFVDATGVDLADETEVVDEMDGLKGKVAVPRLVFVEVSVAVVHHNLVGMPDDGGSVALQHGVLLVEIGADGTTDVATEEAEETFVITFPLGTIDEPKVFITLRRVIGRYQMYAANGVI